MKNKIITAFIILISGFAVLSGKVAPLTEKIWSNPEFIKEYLGSFAIDSEVEPQVGRAEQVLFEDITEMIDDNRTEEVIEELKSEFDEIDSNPAIDFTLANFLVQEGKMNESIKYYVSAIRKFPDFLRARKNLGLIYVQDGNFSEALPHLVKCVELGGAEGDLYGLIGYCYLNGELYASALDAYRMALIFEPNSKDWRLGKAQCLISLEKYDDAIAMLTELIQMDRSKKEFWLFQANAYLASEKSTEAAANLYLVDLMNQADTNSKLLLGDIYVTLELPHLAVPQYLEVLESEEKLLVSKAVRIVEVLARSTNWKEASEVSPKIKEKYSDQFSPEEANKFDSLRAEILFALDRKEEAVKALEELVQRDPLNGRVLLLLAGHYSTNFRENLDKDQNKADEFAAKAIFLYERAANLDDTAVKSSALMRHGQILVRQKKYSNAVKFLERSNALKPRDSLEKYLEQVRRLADLTQS
jgi:tetratricopeptide (TPR) repeat protein